MLQTYAELLWKTPFWIGLGIAVLCATIAWVRASRRAAAVALVVTWLLGFAWAFSWMWSMSAFRNEQTSATPDSMRIAAARETLERAQTLGLIWGGVFAFSLGGYLRARFRASASSSSLQGRLRNELVKKLSEKRSADAPPSQSDAEGDEA